MGKDKRTPDLAYAFEAGTPGLPVNYLSLHTPRDEGFGTNVVEARKVGMSLGEPERFDFNEGDLRLMAADITAIATEEAEEQAAELAAEQAQVHNFDM